MYDRETMMQAALEEIRHLRTLKFVELDECEIVSRGSERFALWYGTAYLLHEHEELVGDEENQLRFEPIIIDCKAFYVAHDEGRGGVLHWQLWEKRRGQPHRALYVSTLPCRWIRQDELAISNQEIMEHIVEEVLNGQTPLTVNQALG